MALAHPSLNTTGKRKAKVKFKSAAEAQMARQLQSDWDNLQKKWGVEAEQKRQKRTMAQPPLEYKLTTPVGRETAKHGSVDTGHLGAVSTKQTQHYTGDKMLGISVLHKSNGVPVFSKEEVHDIAKMRRG